MSRRLRLAWVSCLFALLLACACKKKDPASGPAEKAPIPVVTQDAGNLMFTWIDDKGEFHVEEHVRDVPELARETVAVRPLSESSGELVYLADLRAAGPDGTYPVKAIPRREFENLAVQRRDKSAVLAPRAPGLEPSPEGSADLAGRPAVILYGASWCGPCHQAEAYLKRRGIPYVHYDIEQNSSAAREMQSKLAKAGVRGGSIPVLDVRGRILVGFNPDAVEQALSERRPR